MKKGRIGARRAILATATGVLALSLAAPAFAAEESAAAAPEGAVTVEPVAINGSGCAPGTASVHTAGDKSGFRVRYSDFYAEAGGTADATDRRKNCQVSVVVNVPSGWTFAVAKAQYKGRLKLQDGAWGLHRTNYYWQGSSENNRSDQFFDGPASGGWETLNYAPALVYLECGEKKVLNINTELRVDGGGSKYRSSMSMRSSDGDVDTLFNLSWRKC